jgi:hypothetical protein
MVWLPGERLMAGGEIQDFSASATSRVTPSPTARSGGPRGGRALRIAFKIAGLTAKSVTVGALCVVFEKVMPDELEKRGVSDAAVACNAVIDDLVNSPALPDMASSTALDDVFARLGGK